MKTTIIRFNGGAQAGHGVVTPDGAYHIFAQFGSGTFVHGVRTHLSKYFILHPLRMMVEETFLKRQGISDAFDRTTVSENALVITPFHEIANRLREHARGDARHGSCGLGVGETVGDSLKQADQYVFRAKDLRDPRLFDRLSAFRREKREELYREGILTKVWNHPDARADLDALLSDSTAMTYCEDLATFNASARVVPDETIMDLIGASKEAWLLTDLFYGDQGKGTVVDYLSRVRADAGAIIFEPAQGVLLDEWRGFHPFTTWSTCTLDNANAMLAASGFRGRARRLGIVRAYGTRHGAGPFVTEDAGLTARLPDPPSAAANWQGAFRVGWFDAVAVRYAIKCVGRLGRLDGLAVTCLDRLSGEPTWRLCHQYDDGQELKPGPFKDLTYQETLTQRVSRAKPEYLVTTSASTQEQRVEEHLSAIERETGLPVLLTSHGPTAADKRTREQLV